MVDDDVLSRVASTIDGVMFHFNCENADVDSLCRSLDSISDRYARLLADLQWVSLGGGISFTSPSSDLDRFCSALAGFAERHAVQVYLEPGEAVVTGAAELVTTVVDVVRNEIDIAVLDARSGA